MFIVIKKNICAALFLVCFAAVTVTTTGCNNSSGGGDLIAEPVNQGDTGDPSAGNDPDTTYNDLFTNKLGQWITIRSYSGTIDPIGTTLVDDFDGDGILNRDEGLNNTWVADYPSIECYLAVPVTMNLEVSFNSGQTYEVYTSEIATSDVTKSSEKNMENAHREEINLRTVQFQDSYNKSSYKFNSEEHMTQKTKSGSVSVLGCGGGKSRSTMKYSKVESAFSDAYGETTTKWRDVPFKNNLKRNATDIKEQAALRNARALRTKSREGLKEEFRVGANSGYVRATLYITNRSVNMPVRLSDIKCSLLLEAPDGALLPVQSFRLRNKDYSLFEIDLYGGSTFGPYVVELKNLNSYEIKEAIEKGYNPRIFIIDYKMNHVDDSNYKVLLNSNYAGDNLKIVEENAKGRTAGIKLVGPNLREFFRVVAFDSNGTETLTGTDGTSIAPGVSLEKALDRVSLSGNSFEYAYYFMDFTGIEPEMETPRFVVRTIKSVNGIENIVPSSETATVTGTLKGLTDRDITVYTMKPVNEWSEEDLDRFKVWTVYVDGKYYMHTADMIENEYDQDGNITSSAECEFEYNGNSYPVVEGIKSTIWPGDHYDIVYLDLAEYLDLKNLFGKNPVDTGEVQYLNTRWDLSKMGDNPNHYFFPSTNSLYIGDAGLGDTIEFAVTLAHTGYLDPVFGITVSDDTESVYGDFSYSIDPAFTFPGQSNDIYSIDEAIDLQLSLGLDGKLESWINLVPRKNLSYQDDDWSIPCGNNGEQITIVNRSWNFMEQTFTITIRLPETLEGVGDSGLVKLYLRTAPHNVYRETVWPMPAASVKKFMGTVSVYDYCQKRLTIDNAGGFIEEGDILHISNGERVLNIPVSEFGQLGTDSYLVTLTDYDNSIMSGEGVYIDFDEPQGNQGVEITIDNTFLQAWNDLYSVYPPVNNEGYVPLMLNDQDNHYDVYGINPGHAAGNWAGAGNYDHPGWNSWNDMTCLDQIIVNGSGTYLSVDDAGSISLTVPELVYVDTQNSIEYDYTKNQFFTAPLLERTYEVQVKIVE